MKMLQKSLTIFILIIGLSIGANKAYGQDAQLKNVQLFLTEQGYDLGKADGFMGPKTQTALKKFQEETNLVVTGEVDSDTLDAIQKISETSTKPSLEKPIQQVGNASSSTSPIPWVLFGALITFLLTRVFGKKSPKTQTGSKNTEPKRENKPSKTSQIKKSKRSRTTNRKTSQYVSNRNKVALNKVKSEKEKQGSLNYRPLWQKKQNDELASFRIDVSSASDLSSSGSDYDYGRFSSVGRRPTAAEISSESNACWVSKGKMMKVAGIEISHGMLYIGTKLRSQRYGGTDNCLINPKLKVAPNSSIHDADNIGYWPTYEGLTPKARREYLKWLAGGAKEPNANISFAFLYFYGLERRLFLDKSFVEVEDILYEMKRLQGVYSENHSLDRYVENALSFSKLFNPISTTAQTLKIPKRSNWQLPMNVALYLGNKLKAGEPLSNDDVLLWFLNHPEKHLRTPAHRLEKEFISLLKAKLVNKQPNGPKIRMPKRVLDPEYSACSSTFSTKFKKYIKGIPDLSNTMAPINAVQKLADEAMNELDKLSRLLGRSPDSRGTFKALSLLPSQLISDYGGKKIHEVKTWMSERSNGQIAVFTFEELIKKTTDFDGKKVTKAIHRDVSSLVSSLGWNIVPNPYEAIGTIKPDNKLLLLESPKKVSPEEKPSDDYLLAFLEMSLGAYIAHADNRLLDVELGILIAKVKKINHLNTEEKNRLFDVIKWLSIQTVELGAINRKIKKVGAKEKEALAELAIAVAVADGKIEPGEVKALEAVYQALGFDKKDLYSGLHSMGASKHKIKKETVLNDKEETNFADDFKDTVELDMERIQSTLTDTKKASALLESIFEDNETEASEAIEKFDEDGDGQEQKFNGLDSVHVQLLTELLGQNEWARDDFMRLASSFKLLPDGAMEVINEWAFEKYDEPILEDGESIEVYSSILECGEGEQA